MVYKKKINKKGMSQVSIYTSILAMIILVFLPIYVTVVLSLKSSSEMADFVLKMPEIPLWSNYANGFSEISRYMVNSVIVCGISVLITIFLSSLVAYVLACYDFPHKKKIFLYFIALLAVPGVISLTPQFILYKNLGLRDSWWALILQYSISGMPGAIFLFNSFFSSLPKEIFEAGRIDGASEWRMYWKICLPLSVTVLVIQGLGAFAGLYNDYLWPIMMIDSEEKQLVIPMLTTLTQALEGGSGEPGIKYALYLMSGIPLIFVTIGGLKYFVNGDYSGGMKL